MSRGSKECLIREKKKVVRLLAKIANCERQKTSLDREIIKLTNDVNLAKQRCIALDSSIALAATIGLKRVQHSTGEFSVVPATRWKQVIHSVSGKYGVSVPETIRKITADDLIGLSRDELTDRFIRSPAYMAAVLRADQIEAFASDVLALMPVHSEKPDDLDEPNPDFDPAVVAPILEDWRAELGSQASVALIETRFGPAISSAHARSRIRDNLIASPSLRLMAQLRRHDGGDAAERTIALALESSIKNKSNAGTSERENNARVLDAVAVFGVPGAIPAGVAHGLNEKDRDFCRDWFGDHRAVPALPPGEMAAAEAFDALKRGSLATPTSGPKTAPRWSGMIPETTFEKVRPEDLIRRASHALMDTRIHSPLVAMPKNREAYIEIGTWNKIAPLMKEGIDIRNHLSKARLSMIEDAEEIEAMQGTNPMAIAIGILTWVHEEKERHAPIGILPVSFNQETKRCIPAAKILPNRALIERLKQEGADIDIEVGDEIDIVPKVRIINDPNKIIGECSEECVIGSFNSSRAVLQRRLDLGVFPALLGNPIVRLLAQGDVPECPSRNSLIPMSRL